MKRMTKALTGIAGAALAAFAGYVGFTYATYGRTPRHPETESMLDRFMPDYEVRERHRIRVEAPAETTMTAACDVSFRDSPVVRSIFGLRALPARLMGDPSPPLARRSILKETAALGWRELGRARGARLPWVP